MIRLALSLVICLCLGGAALAQNEGPSPSSPSQPSPGQDPTSPSSPTPSTSADQTRVDNGQPAKAPKKQVKKKKRDGDGPVR